MLTTKVERKQNDKHHSVAPHGIIARMRRDFIYTRLNGTEVTLCAGLTLVVDAEQGIATFGDDHFEVSFEDYEAVYLN